LILLKRILWAAVSAVLWPGCPSAVNVIYFVFLLLLLSSMLCDIH